MKFIVAFLYLLAFSLGLVSAGLRPVASLTLHQRFQQWQLQYHKRFTSDEYKQRFQIFKDNLKMINEHNAGNFSYTLGLNEFAHLTHAEFKAMYLGLKKKEYKLDVIPEVELLSGLPTAIDWRTKGAVTPIKNQGQCGSCWSFSTTGSVEGQWFLKGNPLVGLSEQNLIDCSTSEGNAGCNGGLMDDAFKYIISNNGIDTEASYPYTATGPNACHYKAANKGASISSYTDVTSGSETALQNAVGTIGPISVAMDAAASSFQFYDGGIYWSYFCSSTALDHGVLAVGYGSGSTSTAPEEVVEVEAVGTTWNGKDYWIVKNSWGTSWGLSGYFFLARNYENMCGIATAASYPTV